MIRVLRAKTRFFVTKLKVNVFPCFFGWFCKVRWNAAEVGQTQRNLSEQLQETVVVLLLVALIMAVIIVEDDMVESKKMLPNMMCLRMISSAFLLDQVSL